LERDIMTIVKMQREIKKARGQILAQAGIQACVVSKEGDSGLGRQDDRRREGHLRGREAEKTTVSS
jgi:hypothetical protein